MNWNSNHPVGALQKTPKQHLCSYLRALLSAYLRGVVRPGVSHESGYLKKKGGLNCLGCEQSGLDLLPIKVVLLIPFQCATLASYLHSVRDPLMHVHSWTLFFRMTHKYVSKNHDILYWYVFYVCFCQRVQKCLMQPLTLDQVYLRIKSLKILISQDHAAEEVEIEVGGCMWRVVE